MLKNTAQGATLKAGGANLNFFAPPGVSGLNGTSGMFGGLNITTVQENIVNSWNNQSQSNDFTIQIQPTDFQDVVSLERFDLTTSYGLIPIPVCSAADIALELADNPTNALNDPWWPCSVRSGDSGRPAPPIPDDPPPANGN